ncbi:MAG: hypothetical protein WC686_01035 [Candidatus Shapirobacteria bacterium]
MNTMKAKRLIRVLIGLGLVGLILMATGCVPALAGGTYKVHMPIVAETKPTPEPTATPVIYGAECIEISRQGSRIMVANTCPNVSLDVALKGAACWVTKAYIIVEGDGEGASDEGGVWLNGVSNAIFEYQGEVESLRIASNTVFESEFTLWDKPADFGSSIPEGTWVQPLVTKAPGENLWQTVWSGKERLNYLEIVSPHMTDDFLPEILEIVPTESFSDTVSVYPDYVFYVRWAELVSNVVLVTQDGLLDGDQVFLWDWSQGRAVNVAFYQKGRPHQLQAQSAAAFTREEKIEQVKARMAATQR